MPSVANAIYHVMKPAWNLRNGAPLTAGMGDPGHANAPAAAMAWMWSGKSIGEIFAPALKECGCQ